ncbi:MAG: cobalamin biosynthesis protein CbiD [SAR324 cluster bacterium]|nr:cobalamin biosynthesis protein CbiD [SAR324 cluster bacterium]
MTLPIRKPFDFSQLAENGLRRGVTTGTCATAAVKAALLKILCGEERQEVLVNLIDGYHFVRIPILRLEEFGQNRVKAVVVKDAGDDPDATHQAKIFAVVQANDQKAIRFIAGEGVGTITQPGFAFPIGDPAINPVPREMMVKAVEEIVGEAGYCGDYGFDLEIGCEDGLKISKKTYNARLGIEGGISILGTTGIVEPKSLSSYLASIELYIRIAAADCPPAIVFSPGNIGQRFASKTLNFPIRRIVQMSNFVGFSLDSLQRTLTEYDYFLPCLWLAGHPGKLAKLLDQVWDTHSRNSKAAVGAVCRAAEKFGMDQDLIKACQQSSTVEQITQLMASDRFAALFWADLENQIAQIAKTKIPSVQEVQVRLISMKGALLREISST